MIYYKFYIKWNVGLKCKLKGTCELDLKWLENDMIDDNRGMDKK